MAEAKINLHRGSTATVKFALKNNDGSAFDVAGYTGVVQFRDSSVSAALLQKNATLASGEASIALSSGDWSTLAGVAYVVCVRLVNGSTVYFSENVLLTVIEGGA